MELTMSKNFLYYILIDKASLFWVMLSWLVNGLIYLSLSQIYLYRSELFLEKMASQYNYK